MGRKLKNNTAPVDTSTCCSCFAQTKYTLVDMQKFFSMRCYVFKTVLRKPFIAVRSRSLRNNNVK